MTFIPVAAALTVTPGVATALVIRSALRGGRRAALATTLGNSAGVMAWALAAAAGIAAIVAASVTAFTVVKIAGAVVLLVMGLHAVLSKHEPLPSAAPPQRSAFRDGLVTSVANPKLAVFFVALFPQFVPEHHAVLPLAVAMAAIIVALDLVWYSTLAWLVGRARSAFTSGPWLRRTQRLTGCVLIGLGARLALERR